MQMLRLAANRKFTRAVKKVMEELNDVGIDLRSDVSDYSLRAVQY